jgi:hypothetical protein
MILKPVRMARGSIRQKEGPGFPDDVKNGGGERNKDWRIFSRTQDGQQVRVGPRK